MLPYVLVFSLLILIIVVLFYNLYNRRYSYTEELPTERVGKPCPICEWPLQKGEKVHSKIYESKSDTIMHIFGCPYCYKNHPKSRYRSDSIRICPSCKKRLKTDDYLIARLFEKPGKNHVHVLGCYSCRGKR